MRKKHERQFRGFMLPSDLDPTTKALTRQLTEYLRPTREHTKKLPGSSPTLLAPFPKFSPSSPTVVSVFHGGGGTISRIPPPRADTLLVVRFAAATTLAAGGNIVGTAQVAAGQAVLFWSDGTQLYVVSSAGSSGESVICGRVNGAVVGNTAIFTPVARYYATIVRVRLVTVANLGVTPTISVGSNGPNYDNILPGQILVGLTAADTYYTFVLGQGTGPQASVTAQVFCRVSVAATGAGVVYAFDACLLGDYGG